MTKCLHATSMTSCLADTAGVLSMLATAMTYTSPCCGPCPFMPSRAMLHCALGESRHGCQQLCKHRKESDKARQTRNKTHLSRWLVGSSRSRRPPWPPLLALCPAGPSSSRAKAMRICTSTVTFIVMRARSFCCTGSSTQTDVLPVMEQSAQRLLYQAVLQSGVQLTHCLVYMPKELLEGVDCSNISTQA